MEVRLRTPSARELTVARPHPQHARSAGGMVAAKLTAHVTIGKAV
jgi:hypothetical protein